uniref:Immunoglobulin domain-containing protein n=1 Tax=Gouania willdenowi TaxID=441366 RepID=A0A8C5NBY8_GOUWI
MLHVVSNVVHIQNKTVHVKQDVELPCASKKSSNVIWITIISGHLPEFLDGTDFVARSNRISAKQESGTSVLHIREAKLDDTGLYYCVINDWRRWKIVTGHFVKVKGNRNVCFLQYLCSLLSNSIKKMCSNSPALYWFKSALNKSHPSFIYTHTDGGEDCHSSLRTPSAQRCFYSFSRNFSDAGIYHCAVAACGHILWGQGTHLNTEDLHEQRLHWSITVLCLICAALTITVIVLVYCICSMKKKTCSSCCYGKKKNKKNSFFILLTNQNFFGKKTGKAEKRNVRKPKKETIYSDVVFV